MQKNKQQDKFVSVVKGRILDVVVDCRKKSKLMGNTLKSNLVIKMKNQFIYLKVFYMVFCA